jgi:ATP citrate (pro-S)-lyase
LKEKLVAKPDQLIKRRGKSGLLLLNSSWAEVTAWISERMGKTLEVTTTIKSLFSLLLDINKDKDKVNNASFFFFLFYQKAGNLSGVMKCFIVEPFVPHQASDEYYLCIYSVRDGDEILFYHEGGVDVGDVDSKAERLLVETGSTLTTETVEKVLLKHAPEARKTLISSFVKALHTLYVQLHFTYLEINPFVVVNNMVYYLDLAAKLDQTAEYECSRAWGKIEFPSPFGRESLPEEAYIADLDSKTGSSLKLTILNKEGRIWTMVAGGGASVVYSDAIAAHGFAHELANYGEYSGAPNESQTYEYSKTILDLMTRGPVNPQGKVLIIGGGIANFTNVADTFKGIARALKQVPFFPFFLFSFLSFSFLF